MANIIELTKNGAKPDKRRLNSAGDLRLFLAALIRDVESGKIEESRGRCLGYLCQVLLRTIEGSDLENRIEELEKKMKGVVNE